MAADLGRGDWQCPNPDCFNHRNFPNAFVYGSNVNCKKCGTGKTAKRAGDWCCPNPQCLNSKNTVYGSKAACPKCHAPKPAIMAAMGGVGQQRLGFHPGMPALGAGPLRHEAPGFGVGQGPLRHGDWHCPNPVCKNHTGNVCYGSKSSCTLCGAPRPTMPAFPAALAPFPGPCQYMPSRKGGFSEGKGGFAESKGGFSGGKGGFSGGKGGHSGDWNCPNSNCKNYVDNFVYGSKPQCPLCGAPRPGLSRTPMTAPMRGMTAPMRGMTRPGDWHCPNINCKNHSGNVVFASKSHCPLCMTPKPEDDERDRSRSPRGGEYVGEYVDDDFDIPTNRPYVDQYAEFGVYAESAHAEFGVYADPQY